MSQKITKTKDKRFYSITFDQLSQVEKIIGLIQKGTVSDVQLTILVKLEKTFSDKPDNAESIDLLSAYWKMLLGPNSSFGIFNNHEIGNIFIAGPLTELFLYDVDGKKLGELSEGPYGILRGLGIDEKVATDQVKKLGDGNYLLLVKGHHFDTDGLEGVLHVLVKAL